MGFHHELGPGRNFGGRHHRSCGNRRASRLRAARHGDDLRRLRATSAGARRRGGGWALVSQQLGTSVGTLALLWSRSTWSPRLRFSLPHARRLLGFSSHVFVGNLGTFLGSRADALLIGLFFGPVAVGL